MTYISLALLLSSAGTNAQYSDRECAINIADDVCDNFHGKCGVQWANIVFFHSYFLVSFLAYLRIICGKTIVQTYCLEQNATIWA